MWGGGMREEAEGGEDEGRAVDSPALKGEGSATCACSL